MTNHPTRSGKSATVWNTAAWNYDQPTIDPPSADTRETHPAVAMTIHAISGDKRSPEDIWQDPTPAERYHIAMAVEEYVRGGVFEPEENGRYQWGCNAITGRRAAPTFIA